MPVPGQNGSKTPRALSRRATLPDRLRRRKQPIGTLYVVGTPIGNLQDLTPRAREVLAAVDLIACEDTRVTRKLLARFEIQNALTSYHAHSSPAKRETIVARLEKGDVAQVSDAGTPGVSDPGAALVAAARKAGHRVVALPGPSAVTAALSVSGFPADAYSFIGFLPRKGGERRTLLGGLAEHPWTLVAFETPQRLRAALKDLAACLGDDREIAVARELTKRYEEVWTGRIDDAIAHWTTKEPRGEFTLVIRAAVESEPEPWDDLRIVAALEELRAEGLGAKEASRRLAGPAARPAREIYALWDHG